MRITIDIDTDNSAFYGPTGRHNPGPEIGAIVARIAGTLADGTTEGGPIRDINGNTVGSWSTSDPDEAATVRTMQAMTDVHFDAEGNPTEIRVGAFLDAEFMLEDEDRGLALGYCDHLPIRWADR